MIEKDIENCIEIREEYDTSLQQIRDKLYELKFDNNQIEEIVIGIKLKLDVKLYGKKEFNYAQMKTIRLGLQKKIDAYIYAKPEYDYELMHKIYEILIPPVVLPVREGEEQKQVEDISYEEKINLINLLIIES